MYLVTCYSGFGCCEINYISKNRKVEKSNGGKNYVSKQQTAANAHFWRLNLSLEFREVIYELDVLE